ncbi:MAG: hypothetical protein R3F09_08935 [Burkholderiaceae bacterium]
MRGQNFLRHAAGKLLPSACGSRCLDTTERSTLSNTTFVESLSTDPVERALARKAIRILNDPTLHRQQRVELVRQVQRELTLHRQVQQESVLLRQQAPTTTNRPQRDPIAERRRELRGRLQPAGRAG